MAKFQDQDVRAAFERLARACQHQRIAKDETDVGAWRLASAYGRWRIEQITGSDGSSRCPIDGIWRTNREFIMVADGMVHVIAFLWNVGRQPLDDSSMMCYTVSSQED